MRGDGWTDDGRDNISRPAPASLVGETIDGRYVVEGELGHGGMGTVYTALQTGVGRRVAVKVVSAAEGGLDESLLRRFEREAKIIASLKHPNVVTLFDAGRLPDGRLYIAMELVEGKTLRDVLRAEEALSVSRAIDIARQISQALAGAHDRGIVHRDLKPSNILLSSNVEGHRDFVKVLDFGIAKLVEHGDESGRLTGSRVLGTPRYMSPEQIRSADDLDARSDVYALGLIVYEMLTGASPFSAPNEAALLYQHLHAEPSSMRSVRPDLAIDPGLDALVRRCLSKSRDERPVDARSLDQLLAELRTVTAPVVPPTVPLPMPGAEDSQGEETRAEGARAARRAADVELARATTKPSVPEASSEAVSSTRYAWVLATLGVLVVVLLAAVVAQELERVGEEVSTIAVGRVATGEGALLSESGGEKSGRTDDDAKAVRSALGMSLAVGTATTMAKPTLPSDLPSNGDQMSPVPISAPGDWLNKAARRAPPPGPRLSRFRAVGASLDDQALARVARSMRRRLKECRAARFVDAPLRVRLIRDQDAERVTIRPKSDAASALATCLGAVEHLPGVRRSVIIETELTR